MLPTKQTLAALAGWGGGGWPAPPCSMAHAALDQQCRSIVASFATRGDYATVDGVVHTLCGWHRVGRLEQLGASVTTVPALSLLWHIEQSVATYLAAFMATHGIATLADFEAQVVSSLRSTCTPSVLGPLPSADGFDGYAVGPLARHPAVHVQWQPATPLTPLGYSDAAQHLKRMRHVLSGTWARQTHIRQNSCYAA